jgi:hypothetical protein
MKCEVANTAKVIARRWVIRMDVSENQNAVHALRAIIIAIMGKIEYLLILVY